MANDTGDLCPLYVMKLLFIRYKENPNIAYESVHAQAREALKKYLHYYERVSLRVIQMFTLSILSFMCSDSLVGESFQKSQIGRADSPADQGPN